MLDSLNRFVLQPLAAWKRGSQHLRHLRTLKIRQYDSPETIAARQWSALQTMLHHAYATVPFYTKRCDSLGLHPRDIRTPADYQHWPILTKTDLRTHAEELRSTLYRNQPTTIKRTSGSTGVPLTIHLDDAAKQWKYACTLRSDEWSGYRLGQAVAKVWGNPEYRQFGLRGRVRNWLIDRATYLDTLHLTDARLEEFATQLRRNPPGLLFGHAHSLYLLADHLKRAGVTDLRPGGIVSTAMPLHDWQRKTIEEVFAIRATDRYGCEEVSLIASECEAHEGLHINADSVYVEGAPIGVAGPLIVSDLCNRAMPILRYEIGDHAVRTDRVCSCGRGLPMLDRIEGRDADFVVTPAGALISGISLTENFALCIEGTAQVQIVQDTLTHLLLRIVPTPAFNAGSEAEIARMIGQMFGPEMQHTIERVGAIPQEPSGKYRFCVSKVAPRHARAIAV